MKRYHKSELIGSGVKTSRKPSEGKILEYEIEAMMQNKEPIHGSAELIFTKKRDGVLAAYNPRTDKFDELISAANEMAESAANWRIKMRETETETQKTTETATESVEKKE